MTEQPAANVPSAHGPVIGPDGSPVANPAAGQGQDDGPPSGPEADPGANQLSELVEQPAKVMRIGSMIRQLLEEVRTAPLDDASRARLREIHQQSIQELEDGLAPELVEELQRLSLPFEDESPSDAELRIAQAQLVGWLEGLFHGIQAALYAQQIQAQAQFQNMRMALPAQGAPGQGPGQSPAADEQGVAGGMYL